MFNLGKTEKFIIIFLLAALLTGLSLKICRKHNKEIVDVKIKSFNYEPSDIAPIKININEADLETLIRLEGIGPSLAKRILDYRAQIGRFRSLEELKKVKGVGEKLFEKIKDEVSVE